jgi:Domain of unknown function (DUF4360)
MKLINKIAQSLVAVGSLALLSSLPVHAQPQSIEFGANIASGGNGCPPGTFEGIAFGNELSIIFNQFEAVANPKYTKNASCNLRIPVTIPRGYTIQDITIVSEGFADIPNGGSGAIDTKVIAGTSVLGKKSAQFGAGWSSTFQLTTEASAQTFNACASRKSAILGLNTNLIARATNAKTPTTVNLSTQDVRSEGKLQIIFSPVSCF